MNLNSSTNFSSKQNYSCVVYVLRTHIIIIIFNYFSLISSLMQWLFTSVLLIFQAIDISNIYILFQLQSMHYSLRRHRYDFFLLVFISQHAIYSRKLALCIGEDLGFYIWGMESLTCLVSPTFYLFPLENFLLLWLNKGIVKKWPKFLTFKNVWSTYIATFNSHLQNEKIENIISVL